LNPRAIRTSGHSKGHIMKHFGAITAAGLVLAATLLPTLAKAQNARSFVSGHGLDSNACTLTAPCRTFAVAYTHTNAGGEIDVLDTAGYGPLIIDKAISIVNEGAIASVLVPSGGTGITIIAGASDAVSLRGLTIEGAGVGAAGIVFNTGGSLTVQRSFIRHFNGDGIRFLPNASSKLAVSNTLVADNQSAGIRVEPTGSGGVNAVLSRVGANNNGTIGIWIEGETSTGTLNVTIADSVASNNVGDGIFCESANGSAPTAVMVLRSVAASNGNGISGAGIEAAGAVTILVGQSALTSNTYGWIASPGATVRSYRDNKIDLNGFGQGQPASVADK
jgi:hypothetical protein